MKLRVKVVCGVIVSLSAVTFAAEPAFPEARVHHGIGLASKKDVLAPSDGGGESPPFLATLEQVHTGEHLILDAISPTLARFESLLADRVTGSQHPIDPHLLDLLRSLASAHPGARIELVSGFRSPKLNEMLRKKGHHVASHSQHTLGHACDFRIVIPGQELALDPRTVEHEIRALGWNGGVGVYPTHDDWFVHADVGPLRSWTN